MLCLRTDTERMRKKRGINLWCVCQCQEVKLSQSKGFQKTPWLDPFLFIFPHRQSQRYLACPCWIPSVPLETSVYTTYAIRIKTWWVMWLNKSVQLCKALLYWGTQPLSLCCPKAWTSTHNFRKLNVILFLRSGIEKRQQVELEVHPPEMRTRSYKQ